MEWQTAVFILQRKVIHFPVNRHKRDRERESKLSNDRKREREKERKRERPPIPHLTGNANRKQKLVKLTRGRQAGREIISPGPWIFWSSPNIYSTLGEQVRWWSAHLFVRWERVRDHQHVERHAQTPTSPHPQKPDFSPLPHTSPFPSLSTPRQTQTRERGEEWGTASLRVRAKLLQKTNNPSQIR